MGVLTVHLDRVENLKDDDGIGTLSIRMLIITDFAKHPSLWISPLHSFILFNHTPSGKSDPYVKFYLEQDNMVFDKGYGKMESSKKKNELNPVYGETFTFEDVPGLNNMVLHVTIKDDDIGRDEKLGDCKFKLEGMDLSSDPVEVSQVVDRKGLGLLRKHAKIYLKLSWTE